MPQQMRTETDNSSKTDMLECITWCEHQAEDQKGKTLNILDSHLLWLWGKK